MLWLALSSCDYPLKGLARTPMVLASSMARSVLMVRFGAMARSYFMVLFPLLARSGELGSLASDGSLMGDGTLVDCGSLVSYGALPLSGSLDSCGTLPRDWLALLMGYARDSWLALEG